MNTLPEGLREVFLEEAWLRLGEMRGGLSGLASGDAQAAVLLWRGAHTLRGNAAMADLEVMAQLAAAVERAGKRLTPAVAAVAVPCLAAAVEHLGLLVAALAADTAAPVEGARLLAERLDMLAS